MIKSFKLIISLLIMTVHVSAAQLYYNESVYNALEPIFNVQTVSNSISEATAQKIIDILLLENKQFKNLLLNEAQLENVKKNLAQIIQEVVHDYNNNQDEQMTSDDKKDLINMYVQNGALTLLQKEQKIATNLTSSKRDDYSEKAHTEPANLSMSTDSISSQGATSSEASNSFFGPSVAEQNLHERLISLEEQLTKIAHTTEEKIKQIDTMQIQGQFNSAIDEKEYFETISKIISELLVTMRPVLKTAVDISNKFFKRFDNFYQLEVEMQNSIKLDFSNLIKTISRALNLLLKLKEENLFRYNQIYETVKKSEIDSIDTKANPIDFYSSIAYERRDIVKKESLIAIVNVFIDNTNKIESIFSNLLQVSERIKEKQNLLHLNSSENYKLFLKIIENINAYNRQFSHQKLITKEELNKNVIAKNEKIDALVERYEKQRLSEKNASKRVLEEEIQNYEAELNQTDGLEGLQEELRLLRAQDQEFSKDVEASFEELSKFGTAFYSRKTENISGAISSISLDAKKLLNSVTIKSNQKLIKSLLIQLKAVLVEVRIIQVEKQRVLIKTDSFLPNDYKQIILAKYAQLREKIDNVQIYLEMIKEVLAIFNNQQDVLQEALERKTTSIDEYDYNKLKQSELFILKIKDDLNNLLLFNALFSHELSKLEQSELQDMIDIKLMQESTTALLQKQESLAKQKQQEDSKKDNAIKTIQRAGKNYIAQKELKKIKQEQETNSTVQSSQKEKAAFQERQEQNVTQALKEKQNAFEAAQKEELDMQILFEIEKKEIEITQKEKDILQRLENPISEQRTFLEKTEKIKSTVESFIFEIEKNIQDLNALQQEEAIFYENISKSKKYDDEMLFLFQSLELKRKRILESIVLVGATKQKFQALKAFYSQTVSAKQSYFDVEVKAYKQIVEKYVQMKYGKKDRGHFEKFNNFLKNTVEKFNKIVATNNDEYKELELKHNILLEKETILHATELQEKELFEDCKKAIKKLLEKNTAKLFEEVAGAGLTEHDSNVNPLLPKEEEQLFYEEKIAQAKELKSEEAFANKLAEESRQNQEHIKKAEGISNRREKKSKDDKKIAELEALLAEKELSAKKEQSRQAKYQQDLLDLESKKAKYFEELDKASDDVFKAYGDLFSTSSSAMFKESKNKYQSELKRLQKEQIDKESAEKEAQEKQAAAFEKRFLDQQHEIERIKFASEQKIQNALQEAQEKIDQQKKEKLLKIKEFEQRLEKAREDAEKEQKAFKEAHEKNDQRAALVAQEKERKAHAVISELENKVFLISQKQQQNALEAKEEISRVRAEAYKSREEILDRMKHEANSRILDIQKDLELALIKNEKTKLNLQKALDEQIKASSNASLELQKQIEVAVEKAQEQNMVSQDHIEQLQKALIATQQEKDATQFAVQNLTIQKELAKVTHETELEQLKKEHKDLQQKQMIDFQKRLEKQKNEIERIKQEADQAMQAAKKESEKIVTMHEQEVSIKMTEITSLLQKAQKELIDQQKALKAAQEQNNKKAARVALQRESESQAVIKELEERISLIREEKENIILQNLNNIANIERRAYNEKQETIATLQQTTTERIITLQQSLQDVEANSKKIQASLQDALNLQTKQHVTMTAELKEQIDLAVQEVQRQKEAAQKDVTRIKEALKAAEVAKNKADITAQKLRKEQKEIELAHQFKLDELAKEYASSQEKQKIAFELQLQKQQEEVKRIEHDAEQKILRMEESSRKKLAQKEQDVDKKILEIHNRLSRVQKELALQDVNYKKALDQKDVQAQSLAQRKEEEAQDQIDKLTAQIMKIEKEKNENSFRVESEILKLQQEAIRSQAEAIEKIKEQMADKAQEYQKLLREAQEIARIEKKQLQEAIDEQNQMHDNFDFELKTKVDKAVKKAQEIENDSRAKIEALQEQIKAVEQEKDRFASISQELSEKETRIKLAYDIKIKQLEQKHKATEGKRIKELEKLLAEAKKELDEAFSNQADPQSNTRATSSSTQTNISAQESKELLIQAFELIEYVLTQNIVQVRESLGLAAML